MYNDIIIIFFIHFYISPSKYYISQFITTNVTRKEIKKFEIKLTKKNKSPAYVHIYEHIHNFTLAVLAHYYLCQKYKKSLKNDIKH